MPGGNFEFCCEDPAFIGGTLSLFPDVQFHSAVGIIGIVVFGLVLDVYLYSSFGVVGVGVIGLFFCGGVGNLDEPSATSVTISPVSANLVAGGFGRAPFSLDVDLKVHLWLGRVMK